MKTKLVTYEGLYNSMGAVFSVSYGNDRVIMDFGSAFNPEVSNYKKIDDNWLIDKLNYGLLPKIEGLYARDNLKEYNIKSFEECNYNNAVFISHLHLDHMSNIGAVHCNVPVYMSYMANILEKALEDVDMGVDSDGRDYQVIKDGEWINVGNIRVLPIINSSYSYNMYGYLIKTPDLTIGYTADFSLCNEEPKCVFKEMELFKEYKVDVLYMDNCNFDDYTLSNLYDNKTILPSLELPKNMISNSEHYDKLSKLYANVKGLVVFNNYEREMFDIEKIYDWANINNREVVFEPKQAYLVYKFFNKKVNVYYNNEIINDKWFIELKQNCNFISRDSLLNNPDKYYLQNSYDNISELFNLKIKNSIYIHADGNPFNSEDINRMKNIVKEAGYEFKSYDDPQYYQHGYPNHVKYFVDYVNPKVVIGYHGKHPDRIIAKDGYNFVPELYETYYMENKVLVKEVE